MQLRDASRSAGLPPILGLGTSGGFELCSKTSPTEVLQTCARSETLLLPRVSAELGTVVSTFVSAFRIRVARYGKSPKQSHSRCDGLTILSRHSGRPVREDFNRLAEPGKVLMQADSAFRESATDIQRFYVRSSQGGMIRSVRLSTSSAFLQ